MKNPELEIIRLTEDVVRTSGGDCNPDCIPVQTECTPICVGNCTDVCDCVEGDT